jgi:GST-like protein
VLDRRLDGRDYIAGEYTIADIATFPWTRLYQRQGVDIAAYPNVKRWHDAIAQRPAVSKDMKRTEDIVNGFTEKSWSVLFGNEQYQKR